MSDLTTGLHPTLILKINKVLAAMKDLGYPMKIVQGLRSTAQQQALFNQGRTTPGKIVTNADGVKVRSNHQANSIDLLGHAVDVAFIPTSTRPDMFDLKWPWQLYGIMGETLGLVWGGRFKIVDLDHMELP